MPCATQTQPNVQPMAPIRPPPLTEIPSNGSSKELCSFAELSEALAETVSTPPQHLGQLLGALQKGKIDLPKFCRAVRVSLGEGVLMKAVQRVANKKELQTARGRWKKALAYARSATALLALHQRHLGTDRSEAAAEPSVNHLPPIKRISMRSSAGDPGSSFREASVKRDRNSQHYDTPADMEVDARRAKTDNC